REVTPPHDLALSAARGLREIEVSDVDPDRVPEIAHGSAHVAKTKWRIALDGVNRIEHEKLRELVAIGIGEPHAPHDRGYIRPSPRASESGFLLVDDAPNLLVLPRKRVSDGAVQSRTAKRVVRRPWHLQHERCVAHAR